MPRDDQDSLQRRLERLSAALDPASAGSKRALTDEKSRGSPMKIVGASGMALAVGLIAVAIATGNLLLLIPAAIVAVLAGALFLGGVGDAVLASLPAGLAPKDETRPRVGAGADIGEGAIVEPGATVEMGASIGVGARIRRGAVVRMGATVSARAVIDEGAVIGWGVDVQEDALVEKGAVVGAGATVRKGAVVPAGTRLLPGADWAASADRSKPPATTTTQSKDPRLERIDAACDRIAAELEQAPASVKEFLGASAKTAGELRKVCVGLVERERVLRAESSADALAFLDQERAALEQRIAGATDEGIRRSLRSAVTAIEDQHRQRAALKTSADRLDAELTRLQWTLDGMATQLVRLRTTGNEVAAGASGEVLQSVQQLHDEIDAIAEGLEHAGKPELEPIVAVDDVGGGAAAREPVR